MKAQVFEKYGNPEQVLHLVEQEKPIPKDNEVLVKIVATAINDYDWSMVRGKPLLYRFLFGLSKPKSRIPGMELSGIVEEIGPKVTQKRVGEAVFGDISNFGFGTLAEYIAVPENELLSKPDKLGFEDAAAIPHAATLAYQAIKKIGGIQKGQKILINGGGGGVGTLGLQIAKTYQCHVTGVDSGPKLQMMHALGYDQVLDYKKTDFTRTGETYDLILDCKTSSSAFSYLKALKENGNYISIGGHVNKLISLLFWGKILSVFTSKKLQILALKPNEGLDELAEMVISGQLKTQIDGPYSLEEVPRLIQYFGEGKHQGKIVIKL
ncbi:NAD(P)-dependent alcohol dehydrogenase [Algoriphagus pacificus]|uniref:NAD(P)-dependent alcohol dehydrogenase n=1 Tax=Algoriphagus pacificus TaxID=2811234 RepID=A0ABS3CGC7_9BACT|nr:NAD(P)-dependent alcohol dehydrogenase [Algoriphagus pacificus]MBN7816155.1 NAD(P)-dependent alcohol dehydrogenase [Algoriphagus pacificus]